MSRANSIKIIIAMTRVDFITNIKHEYKLEGISHIKK